VASALRVTERLTQDVEPARGADDSTFARAWRSFVDAVQRDL
jgi:hypothetical protein